MQPVSRPVTRYTTTGTVYGIIVGVQRGQQVFVSSILVYTSLYEEPSHSESVLAQKCYVVVYYYTTRYYTIILYLVHPDRNKRQIVPFLVVRENY